MRVAVVTGATSGIGRVFAERLAHEGWRVYGLGRPSAHFDEVARAWSQVPRLQLVPGDITRDQGLSGLIERVSGEQGQVDLLVNNAGAYFPGDGGFPAIETLAQNLETNLIGQYRVILALLKLLERSASPVVLNVSSGAGALSAVQGPGPLGYRVSKAALNMLTRSLAMDLRPMNIAVHAVDPGYIKTRLNPDGTGTPEQSVDGMWPLVSLHDLDQSGQFWLYGRVIPW